MGAKLTLYLLLTLPLLAESIVAPGLTPVSERPAPSKLWWASAAVVTAGVTADAASSFRFDYEWNPLWRGRDGSFGGAQAAMRIGIPVAGLVAQYFVLRNKRTPRWVRKTFTVVNFSAGGIAWGAAVRNAGVSR